MGLDLAKNVLRVHGVGDIDDPVVRKRLSRAKVRSFFAGLAPCLVDVEACGTAHCWARELAKYAREVKMMPPFHVKPYFRLLQERRRRGHLRGGRAAEEATKAPNRPPAAS